MYKLPDEIKKNPEIDVPVDGIRGWKVGGPSGLVVFFEILPGTKLPEHTHCFQWGFVIEGEIDLTIGGDTITYRKGDTYVIPEGVTHSGCIPYGCLAMDYFSDPGRY
jgi:quercetin dioxygenase-like cupin family protein